jgi:hypothetical protein
MGLTSFCNGKNREVSTVGIKESRKILTVLCIP